MEITPSFLHILGDLFSQDFDGGEFDLITQPLQEMNLNFCLWREFDGMEVQQMGFDGKRLVPKVGRFPTLVTESKHSSPTRVRVM